MSNNFLKLSLAAYPTENWYAEIDLTYYSQKQIVSALTELLKEHSCFPVSYGTTGSSHNGLSVVGSQGRYVGHWNTVERGIDTDELMISTASEDLGDVNIASYIIFQTYFSKCAQTPPLKSDRDAR